MKGDEVKPCPFCGSQALADHRSGSAFVECSNDECGIFMIDMDNPYCDEVVDKWNTRSVINNE